jgi:hypothetical protein
MLLLWYEAVNQSKDLKELAVIPKIFKISFFTLILFDGSMNGSQQLAEDTKNAIDTDWVDGAEELRQLTDRKEGETDQVYVDRLIDLQDNNITGLGQFSPRTQEHLKEHLRLAHYQVLRNEYLRTLLSTDPAAYLREEAEELRQKKLQTDQREKARFEAEIMVQFNQVEQEEKLVRNAIVHCYRLVQGAKRAALQTKPLMVSLKKSSEFF